MCNKAIDAMSNKDIENRIKELAAAYLPDWASLSDGGAEVILTRLFAELEAENVSLFPRLRERIHTLFLNMFGMTKKTASPSHGYVTITPTTDTPIYIRQGTRVGSESGTVFALREPLTAVRAEIKAIFSADENRIVRQEGLRFFDFSGENLEDIFIAFSSESVFCGANSFEITLYDTSRPDQNKILPPLLLDGAGAEWFIVTERGDREITEVKITRNKTLLTLQEEIPVTVQNGVSGRWVRLRLNGKTLPRVISPRILSLSATGEGLMPEALCFNDSLLPDEELYPFEREPTEYDCFYIKSDSCFSKKGSKVTVKLSFNMEEFAYENGIEREVSWKTVMPGDTFKEQPVLEKFVEEVVWEYWNGDGWSRIYRDNSHSMPFSEKSAVEAALSFTCPEDISPTFVAAVEGLFIRCRVVRITPGYRSKTAYFVPFIRSVALSYDYEGLSASPDSILLGKNAETAEVSDTVIVQPLTDEDNYYTYICFEAEPSTGAFSVLPIIDTPSDVSVVPSFELLSGTEESPRWYSLNVVDGSEGFRKNEPVTLFFDRLPVHSRLFGTEGCWLRVIYSKKPEPFGFSSIYFNAAKILQYEERPPQYYEPNRYADSFSFFLQGGGIYTASVEVLNDGSWLPLDNSLYTINHDSGEVTFADGYTPPFGEEPTVRAIYSTTEGEAGNLPEGAIISLLDPIPFVDTLTNPEMTYGGNDSETDTECLERGRDYVRTLGRCISAADYETAALSADKLLARASCVERSDGFELILLPKKTSENAFELIRENVVKGIIPSMPFYLRDKLKITRARYAEIRVSARVSVSEISTSGTAAQSLEDTLMHYLDPIVGGPAGDGYKIGAIPTEDDIKAVILSVVEVRSLKGVSIECELGGKTVSLESLKGLGDVVPSGVRPKIIIVA